MSNSLKQIIVTRHPALIEYLKNNGHVSNNVEHLSHANREDIEGTHVFGILPLWLACHCAKLTEVQLRLPPEKRGIELSVKDIEFYAVKPRTYKIREVKEKE
jgi:hypothetical protein